MVATNRVTGCAILGCHCPPTPRGGFWRKLHCRSRLGLAGADTDYLLRVGGQYFTGHMHQFEILGRTEDLVGIGMWLEY